MVYFSSCYFDDLTIFQLLTKYTKIVRLRQYVPLTKQKNPENIIIIEIIDFFRIFEENPGTNQKA